MDDPVDTSLETPQVPAASDPADNSERATDETTAPSGADQEPAEPPVPEDEDIIRLRQLLFSREMAQLDRLAALLDDPRVTTRMVSEVLAEAIHLRTGQDPRLSMALEPVVDTIVKSSLHSRRNDFVNALYPLMGPTIRKSIAESFRSMMENFSKSVEMAFSWKGLRWRLQALRSGKPFSEIVLLNTLVYRVEQVFCIHRDTGLVLAHLANESVEAQDADMVSAMLTAIRDFVRDCFAGGKDEELHSLQMGEFTVHIESGTHAYIACVMRGTPPPEYHAEMRAALDLLHIEYGEGLSAFDGDSEPFAGAVRYLDRCLLTRYADDGKKIPLCPTVLPARVLAILLAAGGYLYHNHRTAAAAQALLVAEREAFTATMRTALGPLRTEPGLMLVAVDEKEAAPWPVTALRDALARAPEEVLREHGTDPGLFSFRLIPYMSYDPSIVVRRVERSIQPPDSVRMVFDENGTLTFTGTAPMSWIVATREDARAIPGVEHVDVSGVRDPMMDQISAMIARVENTVIEFPLGRDTPMPADLPRLIEAIDTLVELEAITKRMGFSASLTIYGHADAVGDARRNYEISQARARTVAGMLYARGSSMPVAIYGMGAEYPRGEAGEQAAGGQNQASRRIELRVHFALSPSASPEMFRR
ncbi:MAG: OmpA family protein [Planctomycetes bacterium]|nr:OmpA family protein [Planctomycetota bacterium]